MKKLKYLLFLVFCFVLISPRVSAASISTRSGSSSITKGNSVTITVTVSASTPLVSIEGSLSCSGAGVNGGLDLTFDDSSNSVYSKSYTYTIKPTTSGTVTCSTSGVRLTEMGSGNWQSLSNSSVSVKVNEPVVIPPKEYSSNNYLKSLSIEGYSIDFDKDTLEYNIEVPNETEKVNISASVEDSSASVRGTGEISVSEGINKLEVKVTAENGNVRTYVINVTVKELDPIVVTIDDKEYTIIRKEGVLEELENYEKTSINIDNEDVLAYKNDKLNYILVGLKDSDGNANYYLYKDGKYTLYKEYKFNGLTLYILDKKVEIEGYQETKFSYNDEEIIGYQIEGSNDYYLFYAVNIATGEENLYQYDKDEGTVQRYNNSILNTIDDYEKQASQNFLYFIIVSIILVVFVIGVIVISIVKSKK